MAGISFEAPLAAQLENRPNLEHRAMRIVILYTACPKVAWYIWPMIYFVNEFAWHMGLGLSQFMCS